MGTRCSNGRVLLAHCQLLIAYSLSAHVYRAVFGPRQPAAATSLSSKLFFFDAATHCGWRRLPGHDRVLNSVEVAGAVFSMAAFGR